MFRIVILGAGIGGVPAAYLAKALFGTAAYITVISDKEYFNFVPSNPWVAMGLRSFDDVAFPIEPYLGAHRVRFLPFAAARIEAEKNLIVLSNGEIENYDYLIVATGAEPAFDEVPGLGPNGGTHSVIHIEQAIEAHDAYQRFIVNPGPIVIGAAPNASILGPLYEFAFLVDVDLRQRGLRERASITVVTPEPYVGHLGLGLESDTRQLLEGALNTSGIEVICNAKTERVAAGQIHVTEVIPELNDEIEHVLPFDFSVYWPAFRGVAALRESNAGLVDERGFVRVDEFLRNPAFPNIYAVGLCIARPSLHDTPVGIGVPATVYSIQKEVEAAVKNMVAAFAGKALISEVPQRAEWLNDVGDLGARYLSEPKIPLRNINWLAEGKWVTQAKVEFENYFLAHIKTGSQSTGSEGEGFVAFALDTIQKERMKDPAPRPVTSTTMTLPVPLQRDVYNELRALAKVMNREPIDIATQLLEAVIYEAKLQINELLRAEVEQARRDLVLSDIAGRQPRGESGMTVPKI